VLIVVLALWLVAISLVLRFLSVAGEARCTSCGGELELWPETRTCPDCGVAVAAPIRKNRARLPDDEHDSLHALVSAVVQGGLNRPRHGERLHPSAPLHYHRVSSGSTRSANSRTLS
jgi:predicted RNA-binding Zn-ribbon protein involved in translation (DUF1610 family)